MFNLIFSVVSQSIPFLPLALAIYISFNLLNATDLTLDGSFVAGAGIFARCIKLGYSPIISAVIAIGIGALIGIMVASFQRGQKIDSLLAGILATFILTGSNLLMMGSPNISLLNENTLLSSAFSISDLYGSFISGIYCSIIGVSVILLLKSSTGLKLRALGDNPWQMARYGYSIEKYRTIGFALTNSLAASAGCLTAQTVNYADINMGFGVTLTGLGAIILGREIFLKTLRRLYLRPFLEFMSCVLGVIIYFTSINLLLRMQFDPIYLKIILGFVLVLFLRAGSKQDTVSK